MASAVDICNLALQRLGSKSISSLTEDSTSGRACNRIYTHARDSELRAHPWSFARSRATLAAEASDPDFGFSKQYPLPSDCLRILPNDGANTVSRQDDWQIEGRKILTDDTSPIYLVYIKQVIDENEFDSLFTELLISRIAMDIAEAVTQSNTKKDDAQTRYELAKRDARKANAFGRGAQIPPDDPWITARL
jgi:hypothetical protein|tara:strand:+ start:6966 stop:7541 length:576 start_codon:yes stop_codon:yes gene_type:complete